MAVAIQSLMDIKGQNTFGEIQSLLMHTSAAQILERLINKVQEGETTLRGHYDAAYEGESLPSCGRRNFRDSYRSFIIHQSTQTLPGEQRGGPRAGVLESELFASQTKAAVDKLLRAGQVINWFTRAFGQGVLALSVFSKWEAE